MNFPKIATDDLVLFGSLALASIGAALVTAGTTSDSLLAFGVALLVFGLPSALIAFMAAAEEPK
jgi:hypothetical protein